MPYQSNEQLPGSVKDTLPASAQDIWRNAFNSAYDKYKDDGKASQIAWEALKNAGWAKDAQGNWKKDHIELNDIEIFSTGIHHGEKFTEYDLDEIVHNFYELKDQIKPPLKVAHKNKFHTKDGQPALGWLTQLKRSGNKLLATFSDVPKIVKNALSKKLYKRVSSEIYNNLFINNKKYKRALAAVGILGGDIPEVKDLKDIEIFFNEDNSITIYDLDVENGVIKYSEGNTMDEKLQSNYEERIKLLEAENERIKAEKAQENTDEIKKYTEEIDQLKAKIIAGESDKKLSELKTFCETAVAAGKMPPAGRDIILKGFDKKEFSEGEDISIPFENFKEYIEKSAEILDKKEYGFHRNASSSNTKKYTDNGSVVFENADIDAKVMKYAEEHKVEYTEALQKVLLENPELFNEFDNAGGTRGEA